MKIKIDNYAFNKTSKQVTFSDYTTIRLDSVLLITNVESNVIIYNFADPTKGGSVSGNILTLDYDTSSMDNTDKLQIFYEDADAEQKVSMWDWTKAIVNAIRGIKDHDVIDKATNVLRTQIVSSASIATTISSGTVTNVTTAGTLSNLDGYQAKISAIGIDRTVWELGCRSRIT